MTIEEFGKTIKQKYPEYNDLADAELGQKMLSKFPEYQDMVTSVIPTQQVGQKPPSFLEDHPILSTISDIAGTTGLGKGIAQGIFLRTAEGKRILKDIEQGKKTYADLENIVGKGVTNKEIVGSAIQTGVTIGTAGLGAAKAGTALGRIAETGAKLGGLSAITGGAQAFGEGGTQSEIGKAAATSGALGFGLGVGGQAVGELVTLLSSPAVTQGIYNRFLGIPKRVVEKGRSPSKMLIQEGISGSKSNIMAKSQNIANESKKQIQAILDPKTEKVVSDDVFKIIKNNLQQTFQHTLSETEVNALVQKLPLNTLKANQSISLKQLNSLRSELDENFLGSAKWLGNSNAENITALKTASKTMSNIVKQSDSRLPGIFDRYSNAITAIRSLRSELAKPHILSNLLELMASGALGVRQEGFTPDAALKGALYFGAIKAGTSAPVTTGVARALSGIGKSAIVKGIGQVTKTLAPGISKSLTSKPK